MMRSINRSLLRSLLFFSILLSISFSFAAGFYFPESDESWATVNPASVGWNADLLDRALAVAEERNSSGVLILHKGRIMAEGHWDIVNPSTRYNNFVTGKDEKGRVIEDVASAQKSIVAVLAGMAQERGYLELDDSVSKYLGVGWSKASADQEQIITIRHLLSMNSGLATDFSFESAPNTKWLYNTPVYHATMRVLSAATGLGRNELTVGWISDPLGMPNSQWTPRHWASADIAVGYSTTVRELARFGIMIQAGGRWEDLVILQDSEYLADMLSPSQFLNPAYGYLWWINGQDFSVSAAPRTTRTEGTLIHSAPSDLVAMQGALDRKLYLVPSLDLIVARLGGDGRRQDSSFNEAFWEALMAAAPGQ